MPSLKPLSIHSRDAAFIAFALFNVIGVMFSAVVLSCPLVILARTQPVRLGVAFGLITVIILLVIEPINDLSELASWFTVIDYSAFALSCVLVSHLTARARDRACV
jgi:hypothetical protein